MSTETEATSPPEAGTAASGTRRAAAFLAAAAIVVFAIQLFSDNKADVDLWGNVGFVRALPWQDGFQRVNTYSFTEPDRPWVNHEWLGEYVMNRAWQWFGSPGLLALKIALGLCVLGLINSSMRTDGVTGGVRFLCFLPIISTMGYGFSTRPHHFTYLLTALFLWLLKRSRSHDARWLLLLPPLSLLWANLHGAFFIGIVLLGVYAVFDPWSREPRPIGPPVSLLPIALLSAAATFVTPYGYRLWEFIVYSARIPRPYLSEWAPFSPVRDFTSHVDFIALAALAALALWQTRRPRRWAWTAILALAFASALVLRRNIPLFAIAAGFIAAPHVESAFGDDIRGVMRRLSSSRLVSLLLVAFIALSAFYAFRYRKADPFQIELRPREFPVAAVQFLKAHQVRGNAILFFDWAEYGIWHLYPDVRVFIDGRFCSCYGPTVMADYLAFIYRGKEWSRAIDAYPTDIVLVHVGNPVAPDMAKRADWALVYADDACALFLKRGVHDRVIAEARPGPYSYLAVPAHPVFP